MRPRASRTTRCCAGGRRQANFPIGWSTIGQQGFPVITVPAGFTTEVWDRVREGNGTRLAGPIAAALPVAAAAQPSVAPAGGPRPAATLPDSPLGRLGQRFLDVVEKGDSATVARFVADHLGKDVRGRSPAQLARRSWSVGAGSSHSASCLSR